MPKKGHFYTICTFLKFSNFVHSARSKSVLGSFFGALDEKLTLKMYHTTQTKNFKFDLFDLVT